MERDDETGLYLMGARYYACWLGRWTSADPMGIGADGPGLYNYTRGSPVTFSDPSGHERRTVDMGAFTVTVDDNAVPKGVPFPELRGPPPAPEPKSDKSSVVLEKAFGSPHGKTEAPKTVSKAAAAGRPASGTTTAPTAGESFSKGFVSEYSNAALSAIPIIGFTRLAIAEYQAVTAALSGDFGTAVDTVVPLRPAIRQAERVGEKLQTGEYEEAGRATFGALDSGVNTALVVAGGARKTGEVAPRVAAETTSGLTSLLWFFVAAGGSGGARSVRVNANKAGGAALRPYGGPGGGHHVPAKSAFTGAAGYDANAALAIPNAELARLGVSHSAVTGAQMTGYRAFAQTGAPLTWEAVSTIETNALVRGGMAPDMAGATVTMAINALRQAGVSGPTRIPWGR